MKTITSAACSAGAQVSCVQTEHAGFRPVLRRDLMRALRKCRSKIGLTTGDVLVVDTLLSFLPCRDTKTGAELPVDPSFILVIYASNQTICGRANNMCERVLRRHVSKLVKLGLLRRRDSATRKRFPIKSNGKVCAAYGLDLTPLLLAADNIVQMAADIELEEEEIRGLRAQALTLRADLLKAAHTLNDEILEYVTQAKTILRRSTLKLREVKSLLTRLKEISEVQDVSRNLNPTEHPCTGEIKANKPRTAHDRKHVESAKESAGNGQNVRQVESQKTDTLKISERSEASLLELWNDCREIAELFPKPPKSHQDLETIVQTMANYVGIGWECLAKTQARLGLSELLRSLNYIAENAMRIERPEAYLISLAGHNRSIAYGSIRKPL
ncbi:hypothetical protein KUV26_21875 [Leisingera daeponensis]|uniref:Plasmid replication protein C N-terminal domain-containing protein n=1 Tax=Leisingera daeponensis TaxID=405746 RepID=A0ABS7NME1_9RHOB|nr:plasmid replication protein RepC [Leisingera daeponensis]MBY6142091.1 hypothetical protein [Leisingera daeponensis]